MCHVCNRIFFRNNFLGEKKQQKNATFFFASPIGPLDIFPPFFYEYLLGTHGKTRSTEGGHFSVVTPSCQYALSAWRFLLFCGPLVDPFFVFRGGRPSLLCRFIFGQRHCPSFFASIKLSLSWLRVGVGYELAPRPLI